MKYQFQIIVPLTYHDETVESEEIELSEEETALIKGLVAKTFQLGGGLMPILKDGSKALYEKVLAAVEKPVREAIIKNGLENGYFDEEYELSSQVDWDCVEYHVELPDFVADDIFTDADGVYRTLCGLRILVKAPNVESYTIHEGVWQVDNEAFKECTKLKRLRVPYTADIFQLEEALELLPNKDAAVEVFDWPYDSRISDDLLQEIANGYRDEKGFVYSQDRKRLLRAAPLVDEYWIPEGVERIERLAFLECHFDILNIPYTCRIDSLPEKEAPIFGSPRVAGCVLTWDRPYDEVDTISNSLYGISGGRVVDDEGVVYTKNMRRLLYAQITFNDDVYVVPDGVTTICEHAFVSCKRFLTLLVPPSVTIVGDDIFGKAGGEILLKNVKCVCPVERFIEKSPTITAGDF